MPGEGRRHIGRFRNLQRHSEKMMTVQDTQAPSGTDRRHAATTVETPAAPVVVLDPDDLELQEAEAAAKAEEEAGKGKTEDGSTSTAAATRRPHQRIRRIGAIRLADDPQGAVRPGQQPRART
jgi:hypothetical protein